MGNKKTSLSFNYGNRRITDIAKEFPLQSVIEKQEMGREKLTITGNNASGLGIKAECVSYSDYDVSEWVVYFTNNGAKDTEILSDIRLDSLFTGNNPILYHGNGDISNEEGYEWFRTPVKEKIQLRTLNGMSCVGAAAYMRLLFENHGVNIGIGWPGSWFAEISPEDNNTVRLSVGLQRCHMKLHPGETIRTPRVTIMNYDGGEDVGRNTWRRWFIKHLLHHENGKPLKPLYCLHVFMAEGMPEFTGANDENQIGGINDYVRNGLRPDVWWVDAGWYPCDGVWPRIGTWIPDEKRFPNGLGTIGKKCKEEDIKFLLWFEPERAVPDTKLYNEHPEWFLCAEGEPNKGAGPGNNMLNLGIKECCDYMINHVGNLLKDSGVSIYRQDFNFCPEPYWNLNEAPDRIGALENMHQQGYLRYWDGLKEMNPGLIIDSCAGGGRRNDLDTMRRAITLHYTDVGYGIPHIKQKQHRQMFEWLPYFRAHNMNWDFPGAPIDSYAYHTALTPAITDMIVHDADENAFALARKMRIIWQEAARMMIEGDYYPLTECHRNPQDVYAMQFHLPDENKGFIQVLAGKDCAYESYTIKCEKLDKSKKYIFTDKERNIVQIYSGKQLTEEGICHILEKRTGYIYFYEEMDS